MSQTEQETISALRQVRIQIETLQPADHKTLIQIGAKLESISEQIPETSTLVHEALALCLQALQVIFQDQAKDFNSLTQILTATITVLEQLFVAPANPAIKGRAGQMVSMLQAELEESENQSEEDETENQTKNQTLVTLDDIAALLIQIETDDTTNMNRIFYALKEIAAQEESAESREILVKAAREVSQLTDGKVKNAEEKLENIGLLIDRANQIRFAGSTESSNGEFESAVDAEESRRIEIKEVKETVTEGQIESYEPDVLAADSDLSLVAEFVIESREMLEAAESSLLALETDPDNLENVNIVFRAFPTIKGTSAYLGLKHLAGRGELVSLRSELMPVFRLHQLFDLKGALENPTEGILMIVADGRRRCALLVDELLGQQQVVTKTLGQGIGKIPGISGGAILGDGRVGLILDTAELVAIARQTGHATDRKIERQKQVA